jgi:hypothetical protein
MQNSNTVRRKGEQGQALAETALFSVLAVIVIFGILALIPVHRTRTAATSAAYAFAQMLRQSADPLKANRNALAIAHATLDGDWSATFGSTYQVVVYPARGREEPARCEVIWSAPRLFSGLLQFRGSSPTSTVFVSRSEKWKALWP